MVVLQTAWRNGIFDSAVRDIRGCVRWIILFLNPANTAKNSAAPLPQTPPEKPARPEKTAPDPGRKRRRA